MAGKQKTPKDAVEAQVPDGWVPKSAFFRSIMGKGKQVKRVSLHCPECGGRVDLVVEVDDSH